MSDIFLRIADTAIMAGIAVLAVLLLRLIFGRTSSAVKCAMWAVVALRLILLFPIESRYAILPAISVKEMIGERIGEAGKVGGNDEASVTAENNAAPANAENSAGHSAEDTDIDKGYSESADISAVYPDNIVTGKEEREPGSDNDLPIEMNARGDSFSAAEYSSDKAVTDPSSVELRSDPGSEFESMISEQAGTSEPDTEIISADDLSRETHTGVYTAGLLSAAGYIWLAGVIAFLCYAAYSSIRLRSRLKTAVRMDGQQDVYMSEYAASPFVFGILHPVIYMGFGVSGTDAGNVIAHERMHIRRKDHLFKLLSFVLLAFYWFVPWVWAAYYLYCRDMELACDEAVIRDLDGEKRAEYSETLLTFALNRHNRIFCPISFGEIGIRARIKNILKYKKRSVWIAGAAIVVCAAAAVVLFLTPDKDGGSPDEDAAIELSGDGLTSAADSSVDTDPIDSRITEPAPTGIADVSSEPVPTDAAKEPAVQDDAVPVYDPKSGIDVGAILDEYAALHIKAAWQPDFVKRIAFLENDGVIVAVYINARPGGKTDIGSENGIYSIPYSVGCDFYAVTYSENRGECIDCRFVLSSAAVTSGYGQTFALIPAEGGVLWVNVLPNDFGWVERTSAQIWFLSEGGALRYKFSDSEDDYLWWRNHTAVLDSDKKLTISESDTDREYFEKIINEPSEEKLHNNMSGYIPNGYSAINWSEATSIDLEQLAGAVGDAHWSALSTSNMTDQDAIALAIEYFEKNLGYVNRYATIAGIEKAEDGRNSIVLKVLGIGDDSQSVMVIGCDDALENREYAYYIGTSATFERDGIGLKAYVTASWQGSPLSVVFDGYISYGGLINSDISYSLYEQIRGEYLFAGGAGRWSNYLELKADGSFTGKYGAKSADPDNPETDISYICEYSGLFGNAVKISDHI
ncbi:MAG: M56 family metallopeptidase [Lachnospiraceae bacterium]|nr:M56 family metallopeptidase [Lachnospiraceae bacterium]